RRAADARVRRSGISGGDQAQVSLSGSAARTPASQHHEAWRYHRIAAPAHARPGILRVSDPDPDCVESGRRPGFSGAVAPAPGKILRPAAGAAAVQTTDHDLGLRSLFPDRPVLS